MRGHFLPVAAAALALGLSGAAFAQSSTTSSSSTTTTTISPGAVPGTSNVQTETYVGRPLVDAQGNVVGTITERRNDSYVVSAGQYLGVGAKTYVIPQSDIVIEGAGPQAVITTPLSRQQIIVLPSQ